MNPLPQTNESAGTAGQMAGKIVCARGLPSALLLQKSVDSVTSFTAVQRERHHVWAFSYVGGVDSVTAEDSTPLTRGSFPSSSAHIAFTGLLAFKVSQSARNATDEGAASSANHMIKGIFKLEFVPVDFLVG
jgi:hypothetical protein